MINDTIEALPIWKNWLVDFQVLKTQKIKEIKEMIKAADDLTIKQKLFITNYIDNGGNAVEAVRMAGYNIGSQWSNTEKKQYAVMDVIGRENLEKPKIKKYLDDFAWLAGMRIVDIMNNGKEDNQLKAATFIYEHNYWKATQKVEKNTTFSLLWLSQDSFEAWKVLDTYIIEGNNEDIQELPDTIDNY